MTSYRKYLTEQEVAATAEPDAPPAPAPIASDEIEVTPETNKFLDELGEVFPQATVEPAFSQNEVRVHFTTQRPEAVNAMFDGLGFTVSQDSLFHRDPLMVSVQITETQKYTLFVNDTSW